MGQPVGPISAHCKALGIQRYERTVSHVAGKEQTIEHVFEVGDWGGEHIVDAQQELVMGKEIHGLLMVVDLASKEGKAVEPGRIQLQLREFQPESLSFFFGLKTIASCKTVVLFINKADVISGTPAEVEREARNLYKRLIERLERFRRTSTCACSWAPRRTDSTHHLFSHFVERILPKNAYDPQLLQRMKSDAMAADMAVTSFAPALQATQPLGHQQGAAATGYLPPAQPQRGPGFPPGSAPAVAPVAAPAPNAMGARPTAPTAPNFAAIRRPDAKR